ncbi:unnamed protein product [Somion occarium]|uniref:Uncharacterized protein n=1 Tax=Somion occarium TaxID=3059160 RepID=A0ABP1DP42_9APHY
MSHKLGETYSGKNPVPQVATKLTSLVNPERATEAKAQQLQDQSNKDDKKLTEKQAHRLKKGHAVSVEDPTTGEEVEIKNAEEEEDVHIQGKNVLDMDFPPPNWSDHETHVSVATSHTIILIALAYITCFAVACLISNFFYSFALATIPPSLLTYVLLFRLHNVLRNDFEDRIWHSERMRGMSAGSDVDRDGKVSDRERVKESAEWANAVLRGVWPVMNPELFSSTVDMLEDIMQASAPSFIHSVRIPDLGLGQNAARVTSIRSLPDSEERHELGAKTGGKARRSSITSQREDSAVNESESDTDTSHPDEHQREELEGDHVNLEVSFAYRGLPSGNTPESKAGNVHLLVEFFLGVKGIYGFRIPIWVEITGAVGTARIRLQLISDPPFVKKAMISMMGLPRITISVTALTRALPNMMNIPFISGFISSAIDTAVAEYSAPKSMTIDLQQLISGDDIKKDTETLGILVVHIHRATGVKGMDIGGSSDPYITLTYSKLGKPLYSTRIIKEDCNPVFEETAFLMVDVNTIRLREKLSFQLWDSDRTSMDDMLGTAEIEIVDLVRNRGKPVRKVSSLASPDLAHRPGSVEYTVGYYGKIPPPSHLKTDGADPGIPEDLRDKAEFKEARAVALDELESSVLTTPPDPEWPSGILSIQVHEIKDLKVKTENRQSWINLHTQVGGKGQDDSGGSEEEGEGLPSSFCEISLNDELVYKTRVKPITSYPMFNAGTERFVKDWRKAHVTVAVKDSRLRENDAILGIVMLKLSELFINASELTRVYSLEEGLGYGRIRISILFRPIEAKLPPNLLGFDIGSLEIGDIRVKADSTVVDDLARCSLRLSTSNSSCTSKISRKAARKQEDGSLLWSRDEVTLIPVHQRYEAALLISFYDRSIMTSSEKALGVLWLRDLIDNEDSQVEIAVWRTKDGDYSRLKFNYVSLDGNLECWDSDKDKVERIGSIIIDIVFKPGISELHRKMLDSGGTTKRQVWGTFDRERAGGLRDYVGATRERGDEAEEHTAEPGGPDAEGDMTATTTTGPSDTADGDQRSAQKKSDQQGVSTTVQPENAEEVSQSEDSGHGDEDDEHGGEAGGGKTSIRQKFKKWKDNEAELHRDHRGMMQAKPVRTAEWIKDNVEDAAHAVKERFSMTTRKPDIETEV